MGNHGEVKPNLLIRNKSDEELIDLVTQLHAEIGLDSFTATDLILKDVIVAQLEERGYTVTEVLKIEHTKKPSKSWFNQDKEEDGEEEVPHEGEKDSL
jgi:hypothetical protein